MLKVIKTRIKGEYYNDDILSHKIQDGDIFYVSNLCFPQEVNEKLYKIT